MSDDCEILLTNDDGIDSTGIRACTTPFPSTPT